MIKILSIEIDQETQTAKIKMTPESERHIQNMFPELSLQEAIEAYWNLASQHLQNNDNLKTDV